MIKGSKRDLNTVSKDKRLKALDKRFEKGLKHGLQGSKAKG